MVRRPIASRKFDDWGLRECIRPVGGRTPGLGEYPHASSLITRSVFCVDQFFVRLGTRPFTGDSSILLLRKAKMILHSGFGPIVDFFPFQARSRRSGAVLSGEP